MTPIVIRFKLIVKIIHIAEELWTAYFFVRNRMRFRSLNPGHPVVLHWFLLLTTNKRVFCDCDFDKQQLVMYCVVTWYVTVYRLEYTSTVTYYLFIFFCFTLKLNRFSKMLQVLRYLFDVNNLTLNQRNTFCRFPQLLSKQIRQRR